MKLCGAKLGLFKTIIENCYRISGQVAIQLVGDRVKIQSKNSLDCSLIDSDIRGNTDHSDVVILPKLPDGILEFSVVNGVVQMNGAVLAKANVMYGIKVKGDSNTCVINSIDLSNLCMSIALSANLMTVKCENGTMTIYTDTITARLKNVKCTFNCEFTYLVKSLRVVTFSTINCLKDVKLSVSSTGVLSILCQIYNDFGNYNLLLSPITNKNR